MLEFELNLSALTTALGATAADIRAAAVAELYERAEGIMADSQEHYVPVDEGVLRGTGHVDPPVESAEEISVTMGYGGPAAPYAAVVHEDARAEMARQVDRTLGASRIGGWKYLELPMLAAAAHLADQIARGIRRRLAKG
jgi:hypothetical protein